MKSSGEYHKYLYQFDSDGNCQWCLLLYCKHRKYKPAILLTNMAQYRIALLALTAPC